MHFRIRAQLKFAECARQLGQMEVRLHSHNKQTPLEFVWNRTKTVSSPWSQWGCLGMHLSWNTALHTQKSESKWVSFKLTKQGCCEGALIVCKISPNVSTVWAKCKARPVKIWSSWLRFVQNMMMIIMGSILTYAQNYREAQTDKHKRNLVMGGVKL